MFAYGALTLARWWWRRRPLVLPLRRAGAAEQLVSARVPALAVQVMLVSAGALRWRPWSSCCSSTPNSASSPPA